MQLVEVKNKALDKAFIQFPVELYKNEENYIRPLDKDIRAVFDPEKNKNFKNGKAIRWILKNDEGKIIGRIAAFYDKKTSAKNDQPTGGAGFFECINDQEAANKLFDAAKEWLTDQGMEAMDGPINFGDRNNWWGLLVDGFTEPNYQMPYNLSYYQELFENYGWQLYFNQYTYKRPVGPEAGLSERFYYKANLNIDNPDYEYRHITKKEYAKVHEYFAEVYNNAWAGHGGVKAMSARAAKLLFTQMKPIADIKLLWFAFYKGKPVAFFISMPELNQLYKYLNGQWNIWTKLKFLYYLKTNACHKALGVVFGVVPDHQGKGVEAALVVSFVKNMAWKPGFQYKDIEMNWIGDFNPKMMRVVEQLEGEIAKTHITYRYLFDRTKEFKRAKKI